MSVAELSVLIVTTIHVLIMALEMFPPDHTVLLKRHDGDLGFAAGQGIYTAPIVRNAGLFNGFLAAGLFWSWRTKQISVLLVYSSRFVSW